MQRNQVEQFARLFVGRRSDYAIQQEDGHYRRAFRPVTLNTLCRHFVGVQTLATYVRDERGLCRFAVFDADQENGLDVLAGVQLHLAHDGVASYLERSRRGGHLWVLLRQQLLASQLRDWLLPYFPPDEKGEFYPRQDEGRGIGSLIRLPLGVHRLSGCRYPFVTAQDGVITPVAATFGTMLTWLEEIERVQPPDDIRSSDPERTTLAHPPNTKSLAKNLTLTRTSPSMSIRDWVEEQDALSVIRGYVQLDRQGLGCCPFGEHHSDGKDSHPSFRAYNPKNGRASSWYCYAWQRGGNVFDFMCLYYGLDASTMWRRIQTGEVR